MTTNSPNPFDGDVHALTEKERIEQVEVVSSLIEKIVSDCANGWTAERDYLLPLQIALAALTADPDVLISEDGAQAIRAIINREISSAGRYVLFEKPSSSPFTGEDRLMKLYTTPPAQLLRLPEKADRNHPDFYGTSDDFCAGWNHHDAEVQRLNATAQPVSDGWVKCSERMPVIESHKWRTDMPLLISCEVGVIPAYYVEVGRADGILYGFKESFRFGDNDGTKPKEDSNGFIKNVTHWMPLPAAPGGQND